MSEGCSSAVAVRMRGPDTGSPATSNMQPKQRSANDKPPASEYSLFELETLFACWAPDSDAVSAPGRPSCSVNTDDAATCNKDGVTVVKTERSVTRTAGGQSLSSASSCSTAQALSAGASLSSPLRMQPKSSQPPWGRTPSVTSAQTQLLQQHRRISRTSEQLQQRDHGILCAPGTPSSSAAAVDGANSGDDASASGISSPSRTMSSSAALASFEVAIKAQHRATLVACHSKTRAVNTVPGEHRRKSYVCQACGKAFSGLSNLEAHERVHTGEKPFRCDTCGKHFSEAGNLKKHQRVHTGEKPFSCGHCGKRFAWICNLRTHQQSATGCGPQARGGLGLG